MEQLPPIIHESWHQYLQPLFNDKKMLLLKHQILPNCHYYPESKNIFRVFSMPLSSIRVVILGQDPYPNSGEANGFAFAVNATVKTPKSLEIIRAEVINSKVERDTITHIDKASWKELKHWHQQGVFLLNTALTVEFKNAGSHIGYWQWFTREVIKIVAVEVNPVWMLWGAKAQALKDYTKAYKDSVPDIIAFDHPAAEVYNGGTSKNKFSGSNTFKKCNELLKARGKNIVNW